MLAEIYRDEWGVSELLDSQVLRETQAIFGKAIEKGVPRSTPHRTAFKQRLKTSTDVFSVFRVHRQAEDIAAHLTDEQGNRRSFGEWAERVQPYLNHQNRAWLQTEYTTAIRRAHDEADWVRFREDADIYPNLEWVPSMSAQPGADHKVFWGTVLPIGDEFWTEHRPGDRWNCKCSLRQTDKAPTATPRVSGKQHEPQAGLRAKPGSEEVFSEDHAYYPEGCTICPFGGTLKGLFADLAGRKKDCNKCKAVRRCLNTETKELIKQRKNEYQRLDKDENYTNVKFDKKTGGLMATHRYHIEHLATKEETFFGDEKLTSTMLEKECQYELFKMGHKAILENEIILTKDGRNLSALDLNFNAKMIDIASITGDHLYGFNLLSKNSQLRKYNARSEVKEKSDALILYFHDPALFSETKMRKSINFFKHYRDKNGNLIERQLKEVICVIKGESEILTYRIE